MGPKNAATGPTDHGLTVSPPPPPAPPAQEEMKLEYTDVHKRFKTLVDDLLTGFLEELGVSPETFMEVATKLASNKLNQFVVNSILIVDDFLHFKNMMVQRNIELTQQVLQQLEEQRSGAAAAPSPEKPEIVAAEEPEVPQPETPEKPAQAGGQPAAPAEADEADADLAAAIAASLQVQQTAARQDSREDEELKQALALSLQEEETRKEVQEAAKVVEEREREETLATSSSSSSAAAAASSSSGGAVRAMVEEGAKLAAEAAPAEPELAKQGSLKGKEPAAAPAAAAVPPPPPPKVTLPESPAHRSGLAALNPPKKLAPLAAPAERAPTFNRRSSIGASIKSAGFSSTASTTAGMSGAAGFGAGGGSGGGPQLQRQQESLRDAARAAAASLRKSFVNSADLQADLEAERRKVLEANERQRQKDMKNYFDRSANLRGMQFQSNVAQKAARFEAGSPAAEQNEKRAALRQQLAAQFKAELTG